MIEKFGYQQELKRTLSLRDLVIFGMVFMAPVSSMTLFGIMSVTSQGHNVLAYLFGFIAMLFTAISYGKMVEAFPVAGSTYSYTQRAIDPKLGFIAGWVMLLDYFLIPMFLYVVSASFASALIPAVPFWVWILIYVIPVTIVNYRGVEVAAKVNVFMAGLMVAAIIAFVIAAVRATGDGQVPLFNLKAVYNSELFSMDSVVAGSAMAVLSYLGFDGITTLSEEVNTSTRKVRVAILLACVLQTVLYLAVSYFGILFSPDYTAIGNPDTAFFELAFTVGGEALQTFISMVIIVSGAATALAGQSSASRLLYGMGRDKLIPASVFSYLHPTYKTPTYSILIMGIVGAAGAVLIPMNVLADMVTFGGIFGFICVNLSVFVHFYIKRGERNPVTHLLFPLFGVAICGYILLNLSEIGQIVGFSWMGAGIAYLVIRSMLSSNFKQLLEKNSLINPDCHELEDKVAAGNL